MVTFTVIVEDEDGVKLATFRSVRAQTKKEAINKVKSALTYTAQANFVEVDQNGPAETVKATKR